MAANTLPRPTYDVGRWSSVISGIFNSNGRCIPLMWRCRRGQPRKYPFQYLHSMSRMFEPDSNIRDMLCQYCKGYFIGWPRLHRHIKGIHRPFELKIPEITLDQRPTSYVGRGRVLAAIQQQQRWRELWRD